MSTLGEFAQAITQADARFVAIVTIALSAVAALCAWRAWSYFQRARLIEDTPTAKARSAPQGYVELEGVAKQMAHTPILARLSALPCCWYRYKVEELEESHERGQTRTRWKTVDQGESTENFWLDDGTGRVAVDPEGAEVIPRYKDLWQSRSGLAGIARQTEFFVGFFAAHSSAATYRFTEERINRNDPIYAIGLIRNLGSHMNGPTLDERVREMLREWKQNQPVLHERFDLNRDGKIDEKEWMLARRAARREAEAAQVKLGAESAEGINLLTHPRDARRPFIISAWSQKELVHRKRWWALGYGLGFLLSGTAAVWLYQTRFTG